MKNIIFHRSKKQNTPTVLLHTIGNRKQHSAVIYRPFSDCSVHCSVIFMKMYKTVSNLPRDLTCRPIGVPARNMSTGAVPNQFVYPCSFGFNVL